MVYFLVILIAIPVIFIAVGIYVSAPRYNGPASDHFDGKKFFNPNGIKAQGLPAVLKWMISRKRGQWTPDLREAYGKHPLSHEKENIRITFINHSTCLIQVDGLNILTDPIWSQRPSPFTWAGPKRMRLPGIKLEDLPRIHAVLISHNHYDHLDLPTLRTVYGAHHPQIITPLGIKAFLDKEGIMSATDLDWWRTKKLSDHITVQSVPAQHFSGRGLSDRDATLWCGYVLKTSRGNIYFAGDTGYNDTTFKRIEELSGPVDIALIPIGAYKPEWFMSPIHVSPEEAVKIHLDVKSKLSIGMHFGTFQLADDGGDEPVEDLRIALSKHNVGTDAFIVLQEGEVKIIE